MLLQYVPCVLDKFDLGAVDAYHLVSGLKVHAFVRRTGSYVLDLERNCQIEYSRGVQDGSEQVLVYMERSCVSVPEDCHLLCRMTDQVCLKHSEVFRNIIVKAEDLISCAETHLSSQLVCVYPVSLVAYVAFSPSCKDCAVYYDCEYEIEKNSSGHHKQSLPCRFCPELPRLWLAFKVFRVHGFVYHSCDLAVSSQRHPAYSVFGLPVFSFRTELGEPS